jgi:hypothetical protein
MLKNFVLASALLIGVSIGGFAMAQAPVFGNPKPLSNTGGYAAQEMRSVYRSAIGTGYSANTLNQLSLNRATARIPNVGQASAPGSRLDTGLGGFGNSSKPYANYSPAPTVSPYLNLFREDLDGQSDLNYQTLVQPQLRQQAINERQQRENFDLTRRLQSIAAQSDYNPAGSTSQPPTGHQTVFMYYGHYYPALGQQRRR